MRQKYGGANIGFIYGKEGLLGFIYNGETYLYQKKYSWRYNKDNK